MNSPAVMASQRPAFSPGIIPLYGVMTPWMSGIPIRLTTARNTSGSQPVTVPSVLTLVYGGSLAMPTDR